MADGIAEFVFTHLLDVALKARASGDYPISAAIAIPVGSREVIISAGNTVFSARDPCGHAEINALRRVLRFATGKDEASRSAETGHIVWEWPRQAASVMRLYSTLEPCPMCTVAIVNAGIREVLIATADPEAGAMALPRQQALAPLWRDLLRNVTVRWVQSDDPSESDTYVSAELVQRLLDEFGRNREQLDEHLAPVC